MHSRLGEHQRSRRPHRADDGLAGDHPAVDRRLSPLPWTSRQANIHLALEDVGGDSAIIEFADGHPVVHHGRQYTLMTNDPTYDEQLKLIAAQDFSNQPQPYDDSLVGDVTDRFAPVTSPF